MMNNTTMESLALPEDLYWDVKSEPNSPPTYQLFSIFEDLSGNMLDDEEFFANDLSTTMCNEELPLKHDDMDFTQALIGEEFVVELYNLKEENLYSPSPLLDNSLESVVTNPTQVIKVQTPIDINSFGFANHGASVFTSLTPPSSPPQIVASPVPQALESSAPSTTAAITDLSITINDVLQNAPASEAVTPVQNQFVFNNWNNHHSTITDTASSSGASSPTSSSSSNYDIVLNTQIIDDILKSAANEFFEETESQSSVSAPSTADYSTTDDEWMPSSGNSSPSQALSSKSVADASTNSAAAAGKKRTRPYGRGVEDRKKRKKEQNKNAATRYRQKKKLEMEIIQTEEQELSQRHEELKCQLAEHKREAKYLRRLIREFYAKKP